MKELSLLMLLIAIIVGMSWLLKNIFQKDLQNKTYFITPSAPYFNIAWGMLFYLSYGYLKTTTNTLYNIFLILIAANAVYIIYLYLLKKVLNGKKAFGTSALIKNIITQQTLKQINLDKKLNIPYTTEKSRKILGLEKSQISKPETINTALQKLKKLNISPLTVVAENAADSLKSVINS